jgi:hypothetical protein
MRYGSENVVRLYWRAKSGQALLFWCRSILASINPELLRIDSLGVIASQRFQCPVI